MVQLSMSNRTEWRVVFYFTLFYWFLSILLFLGGWVGSENLFFDRLIVCSVFAGWVSYGWWRRVLNADDMWLEKRRGRVFIGSVFIGIVLLFDYAIAGR